MLHTGYIDAVVAELDRHDLPTTGHDLVAHPHHHASIHLHPNPIGSAYTPLEALTLAWEEYRGWSLVLAFPPDALLSEWTLHRGEDVLPHPVAVASWTRLAVTLPSATPNRVHTVPAREGTDAVFRARLATYAAT